MPASSSTPFWSLGPDEASSKTAAGTDWLDPVVDRIEDNVPDVFSIAPLVRSRTIVANTPVFLERRSSDSMNWSEELDPLRSSAYGQIN